MIGTDMAVGKMTTGLELTNSLKAKAKDASQCQQVKREFVFQGTEYL